MQCFLSVRLVYGRIHPYVQSRTRPRPPIRIRPAFYAALWCSFLLAYAPNMTDEIKSEYFPQCAEDIFWADRKRVQTLIDLYCIKSIVQCTACRHSRGDTDYRISLSCLTMRGLINCGTKTKVSLSMRNIDRYSSNVLPHAAAHEQLWH